MKAAFLDGPKKISVRSVPDPVCPEGGLLTKVEACAICGSDIRVWEFGSKKKGEIIGHEIVATVLEVGQGVTQFVPGDRITDVPATCGVCEYCRTGAQNLCLRRGRMGEISQGGFADLRPIEKYGVSGGFVVKVPQELETSEAIIIEPLACVLNGHEKVEIDFNSTVVIVGAGPIGAMHLMVSRMRGAKRILMIDLLDSRLEAVKHFQPDALINGATCDPVEAVNELTKEHGADVVIVACVSATAQTQAMAMASRLGQVLLFAGLPESSPTATLDTNLIHYKELRVVGARSSVQRQWEMALDLIARGKIDASKIVSHTVALEDIDQGFELAKSGAAMKVAVVP